LYSKFGFTAPAIASKAKTLVTYYHGKAVPHLVERIF
jgi:hypothetical protein